MRCSSAPRAAAWALIGILRASPHSIRTGVDPAAGLAWHFTPKMVSPCRRPHCPTDTFGCLAVLGAWLRRRFNMSHSCYGACFGAQASASQIGSGVVSGVDLYSIVQELVGTAETAAVEWFSGSAGARPGGSRADPGVRPTFTRLRAFGDLTAGLRVFSRSRGLR